METYFVNKKEQNNGDHEVHKSNCNHLPASGNLQSLGLHSNCHNAVKEAKRYYSQSNGCYHCCYDCHTS